MVDLLDKNILDVIDGYKPPEKAEGAVRAGAPIVSISITELKQRLKYNVSTEVLESRLKGLEDEGFIRSEEGGWRLTFKGKMLLEDFWDTLAKLNIVEEVEKGPPKVIEAPQREEEPSEKLALPTAPEWAKGVEDIEAKRQQAIELLSELRRSYEAGLASEELYNSFREQLSKRLDEMEREIEERTQSEREVRFKETEAVKEEVGRLPEAGATSAGKMGFIRGLGVGLTEMVLFAFSGIFFFATGVLLLAKVYQPSGILLFGLDAWISTLAFGVALAIITGIYISFRSSKHEGLHE